MRILVEKLIWVLRILVGKLIWVLRMLVEKLIWVLIIVGILVAKWVIRRILGVELIVIGIHFTNQRLKL